MTPEPSSLRFRLGRRLQHKNAYMGYTSLLTRRLGQVEGLGGKYQR